MKSKVIIIIVIILLIGLGIYFYAKSKKDKSSPTLDLIFGLFGGKNKTKLDPKYDGITDVNKQWLMDNLGLGSVYLERFSTKDAQIARDYIEGYIRKGVKITPTDPMYNDVVRIAAYSNLFNKPA